MEFQNFLKRASESKLEGPLSKHQKISAPELKKSIAQVIALEPLMRLLMRPSTSPTDQYITPASVLQRRDQQETSLKAGGRESVALWNKSVTLADTEAEIERRTNQLKFLVQQRNEQLAKMEREERPYECSSEH